VDTAQRHQPLTEEDQINATLEPTTWSNATGAVRVTLDVTNEDTYIEVLPDTNHLLVQDMLDSLREFGLELDDYDEPQLQDNGYLRQVLVYTDGVGLRLPSQRGAA
jgi:hypothetical protein